MTVMSLSELHQVAKPCLLMAYVQKRQQKIHITFFSFRMLILIFLFIQYQDDFRQQHVQEWFTYLPMPKYHFLFEDQHHYFSTSYYPKRLHSPTSCPVNENEFCHSVTNCTLTKMFPYLLSYFTWVVGSISWMHSFSTSYPHKCLITV